MSRKSIYDVIETEKLDAASEYARLCYRFRFDKVFFDGFVGYSIKKRVEDNFVDLVPLSLRSTCVSLRDLLGRLDIAITDRRGTIDDISSLTEFVMCVQDHDHGYHDKYNSFVDVAKIVLEKAGMQVVKGKEGRIIIPLDCKMNNAAEIVANRGENRLALELLDYRHRSNSGKLMEKASILRTLGNYIEPIIKNNKKSPYCDAGFLLNYFVRHNNDSNTSKKEYSFIAKMSSAEKEVWYDRLYDTIIAVIVDDNQNKIKDEIEKLKKDNKLGRYGRNA